MPQSKTLPRTLAHVLLLYRYEYFSYSNFSYVVSLDHHAGKVR